MNIEAHSENEFAPVIVDYVRKNTIAYWNDLYDAIENEFALNSLDYEPVGGYLHRFHCHIQNTKCNKSIIKNNHDIVQIRNGFALRSAVSPEDITDDGLWTSNQNKGRANPIKKARVAPYEVVNRLNILYDQSKISDSMVHALYIRNGVRDAIVAAVVKKPIAQGDREALDAAIHAEVSKYTPKAA